jgi:choline-glycine betaine transporter
MSDARLRQTRGSIHPGVFWPALTILAAACFFAIAFPDGTGEVLRTVQTDIVGWFGW